MMVHWLWIVIALMLGIAAGLELSDWTRRGG